MAVNLKGRLEKLEAATPAKTGHRCLVIHKGDCKVAKSTAVADFVAEHGQEPEDFIDIIIISAETKQSVCGCPLNGD